MNHNDSSNPELAARGSFLNRAFGFVVACWVGGNALAASVDPLQGTWSGKRTVDGGAEYTQLLDIRGDKLRYTLSNGDNEVRLFAKGNIKVERLGSFQVLKVTDIEAGSSESEAQAISDDRDTIFVVSEDQLILASNFDKVRDNQGARVDVYTLKARPQPTPAEAAVDQLIGKWKLKVKLAEDERDYELVFEKAEGGLAGSLISPRSGVHKLKMVSFKDGQLTMEMAREIQGTEATISYKAELKGGALEGTFVVKGYEDQYKGTWSGTR